MQLEQLPKKFGQRTDGEKMRTTNQRRKVSCHLRHVKTFNHYPTKHLKPLRDFCVHTHSATSLLSILTNDWEIWHAT